MVSLITTNGVVPLLQSYSSKRAFIAAQSPVAHTRNDIWELIWQFRTSTVVLLCDFNEDNQVTSNGNITGCRLCQIREAKNGSIL